MALLVNINIVHSNIGEDSTEELKLVKWWAAFADISGIGRCVLMSNKSISARRRTLNLIDCSLDPSYMEEGNPVRKGVYVMGLLFIAAKLGPRRCTSSFMTLRAIQEAYSCWGIRWDLSYNSDRQHKKLSEVYLMNYAGY